MINHMPDRTDLEIENENRERANRDEAIDTLARTLWGEARGEGRSGMEAVASVILNRVKRPCWWGRTIVTVCLKPYQFACWNQDDPNRQKLFSAGSDDPSFKMALDVAAAAVDGRLPDSVDGSTHYHTPAVAPPWARGHVPVKTVGGHMFYRGIA